MRRFGKSYAHPLVVLVVQPSDQLKVRAGVTAGKTVGNAVQRNRAKRLLRAALQALLPDLLTGSDILLIARPPMAEASLEATRLAILNLLRRAGILNPPNEN